MDTMQSMRVVLGIVDHGSLTAAAEKLDVSLPTVVRVLASIEQHLGVRLFERTTRQVRITEEGRLYAEVCRTVIREIGHIEDVFRDRESEPSGALNITAPVLFGRLHVAPVLNGFMTRFPNVTVTLNLIDRVTDLLEEGIDIAVRIGHVSAPDLVVVRVGQVRRYLCASPTLLAILRTIKSPADLANAPFIRLGGLVSGAQLTLQDHGKPVTVKMNNIRMTTNNGDAAISACLSGVGVGFFLSYQVQQLIDEGKLERVLIDYQPEPLPVSLVYLPSRRVSIRSRAFITWSKEKLGERLNEFAGVERS
ncbi:LysR family transcriptional regulator [Pseudomonas sp. 10B1]|uniref:LysR family transcriptional regulator n=2 Tax=Pseudomonadota TaxID=1224 RepID=UPI002AB384B8|nr:MULTISPECIES: LysR family transcriptional regulator [unclassified Pseudomonas]MDY7560965.1 LysR family transcriptional regulator [Pseudomonas sp. AB6]MEA9978294.1 LysR family transcriptional regulator [Pseudomonas sp. RTS4]MEA9995107.1 LysR family transcriptional regulator [Pseudomonas sp. AA4]MEB0086957.1 LysR family transcriptional regulator [Pseudomonas sp. RTI1]MEB0126776.1 LysR family transcriptional regulator [Pseudomonas sp. CCC1.2]